MYGEDELGALKTLYDLRDRTTKRDDMKCINMKIESLLQSL